MVIFYLVDIVVMFLAALLTNSIAYYAHGTEFHILTSMQEMLPWFILANVNAVLYRQTQADEKKTQAVN